MMLILLQCFVGLISVAFAVKYLLVNRNFIRSITGHFNPGYTKSKKRKLLFVIAHPDDECMFFAPSILKFSRPCDVYLLCVTSGNYDQQGDIRRKELFASAVVLGLAKNRVILLDNKHFRDGPLENWDTELLASFISSHIKQLSINTVITFDEYGISGHRNHTAVHKAVRHSLASKGLPEDLTAYQLLSISLLRKYSSFLDIAYSCVFTQLAIVSSWKHIWHAQRAMWQHRSQFVWFRWLYVLFSRYMLVNTLQPLQAGSS